jgi:5'-3' exoribonuclease 1
MVSDAAVGGVPFSLKGVVIGLNATSIDVVWDSPFIGGETLSGRCSEHRGSIVPFASCLNLTRKQFAVNKSSAPKAMGRDPAFQPKFGPQPVVPGQHFRANQQFQPQVHAASQGFRSRPPAHQGPMQYGNAAQGIRPRPAPAAAQGTTPQVQILHQALTGKTGGPIRPVRGRGGFAARPMNGHAVAPPHVAVPVPHNGATPVVRPTRGHPRGRGGFAGRGRGASNGTPSAQTAA